MKSAFQYVARSAVTIVLVLAGLCVLATTGCHGYRFGNSGLFNREIKTVYVPMVQADTFRDGLGERLTEAICKKITTMTPYDLADSQSADSILVVHLTAENQFVSALNKYNDTRQKTLVWTVSAVWQDQRQNVIAQLEPIPLTAFGVTVSAQNCLVAEMGQSGSVSQQEIIDKLANQIVGLMEEKW